jgi:Asp-tRNA(Asn)/Glu-tRNA(Gln) amidotransferase B subunit
MNEQNWQLMHLLVPPIYLAAIIDSVRNGTISHASAKIVFNDIFDCNFAKLLELKNRNDFLNPGFC